MKIISSAAVIVCIGTILPLLNGCNFVTHSYNTGKLLLPGETMSTVSVGKRSYYDIHDSMFGDWDSVTGYWEEHITPLDTTLFSDISLAYDFRLGVLSKYPFGSGMEIGFLIEAPSQGARNLSGVPLLQFDARFGLPRAAAWKTQYHHDLSVGWVLGQSIDNSWFLEYAGGIEFKAVTPYFNGRIMRVATDPGTGNGIFNSDNFLLVKKNTWSVRLCTGVSFNLPKIKILPDRIVPEVALYYPTSLLKTPGISWHIGMRWLDDK